MQPYNSHEDTYAHRCKILLMNQPTPTPCFTDGNADHKPVISQIDPLDITFLRLYSFHDMHCRCNTSNGFIVSTLICETLLVRWYPSVHMAARTLLLADRCFDVACAIYKNSIHAMQWPDGGAWMLGSDCRAWLTFALHLFDDLTHISFLTRCQWTLKNLFFSEILDNLVCSFWGAWTCNCQPYMSLACNICVRRYLCAGQ